MKNSYSVGFLMVRLICVVPKIIINYDWLCSVYPLSHGRHIVSRLAFEPVHEISINVVCATSKASDQPAHTRSLIRVFASRLDIL